MADKSTIIMTHEQAQAEIRKKVYDAALFFEWLEGAGLIRGNGHHMAQKLSDQAVSMLAERWTGGLTDG